MSSILSIIIMFALAMAAIIFIPRFMVQRALLKVVKIFRQHNAFGAANAKTKEALGLNPLGFVQRMASPRDYKPTALKLLATAEILLSTEDGKMYMVEEKLNEFLELRGWK
jgi:hypothetical protein